MRQFVATIAIALLTAAPVAAQDDAPAETDEGLSLMEEGARIFMRGLLSEMEPAIDELREGFAEFGPAFAMFAQEVGPAFAELLEGVDDIRHYDAPEFLPNGDIIMRRSDDAPPWTPPEDAGADAPEVEL